MSVVCVIPARGGSKRIPQKNVRSFCGKPVLGWSIDAAERSGCFDRIIVSTDDPAIAELAELLGAEVPFLRPPELSHDHAGTNPVVAHAVRWLLQQRQQLDAVCCLYATAPLVLAGDIERGLDALCASGADFAVSVTTFAFPIQRAVSVDNAGYVHPMFPVTIRERSQDLEEAYHDAGQFYWGRPAAFIEHDSVFLNARTVAVRVPRSRVQDIDTLEDWERAELMFRVMRGDD